MLSFRGGSVQSELDAFFDHLGAEGAATLVSDRALAKARSKLNVPALWALNDRLVPPRAQDSVWRCVFTRRATR